MIPNISEHIRILLYSNECVIVPGLGGFISNSKPVLFEAKGISPASKKPFFNRLLKNNDGLLAGYLAQKENITYSDALSELDRFSASVLEQLKDSKQSVLRGLGVLSENEDGNISFLPNEDVNVFISSYGLPSLQIEPLKKVSQTKFREATPLKTQEKRDLKIRGSYWWTGIAASIILAMGIWGYFAKDQWWPQHDQQAMINPFEPSEQSNKKLESPEEVSTKQIIETPDSKEVLEETLEFEEPKPKIIERSSNIISTDSVYYIVVGAFKSDRNALKLERKIKAKGYSTSIYHSDETAWIRVCAEQHTKRFEAEERLDLVRSDANPNAWILAVKP